MFIFRPKGQGKSERQERLLADAPPQEGVKRVAPCHIFNPPPRHLVLHGRLRLPPGSVGRLRLPGDTSSSGPHRPAPAEFLLQLQPKAAMQPALRIGIEPGVFYLLPATEPESPLLRASSPAGSQHARAQSDLPASLLPNTPLVELREHVISMPEMPGESQTWSDTSSEATLSSSVISFFTACSDPSSGPNTRDNTIDFSRGSTTDLASCSSGSAASTIDLGAGGATAAHAGHLADRLAVLTVAEGGADLEGGDELESHELAHEKMLMDLAHGA